MSKLQRPAVSPKERAEALMAIAKIFFKLPLAGFHTESEKLRKTRAVSQFAVAAGELLGFINYEAEIPDSKKDRLIRCFFHACLACQEDPRIFHETAERLGKEITKYRTAPAQAARRASSEPGRKLVYKCLDRLFGESSAWQNRQSIRSPHTSSLILRRRLKSLTPPNGRDLGPPTFANM